MPRYPWSRTRYDIKPGGRTADEHVSRTRTCRRRVARLRRDPLAARWPRGTLAARATAPRPWLVLLEVAAVLQG
jgi:hypothetical protein